MKKLETIKDGYVMLSNYEAIKSMPLYQLAEFFADNLIEFLDELERIGGLSKEAKKRKDEVCNNFNWCTECITNWLNKKSNYGEKI